MGTTPMFIQNLRPLEIIIILLIVLLLFGSKKLPDLARGVGKSLRIFRAETRELRAEEEAAENDEPEATASAPEVEPGEAAPIDEPVHNPVSGSVSNQQRPEA